MESDLDLAQLGSWLRTLLHKAGCQGAAKSDIGTESPIMLNTNLIRVIGSLLRHQGTQ
jgi:hypothetical protein